MVRSRWLQLKVTLDAGSGDTLHLAWAVFTKLLFSKPPLNFNLILSNSKFLNYRAFKQFDFKLISTSKFSICCFSHSNNSEIIFWCSNPIEVELFLQLKLECAQKKSNWFDNLGGMAAKQQQEISGFSWLRQSLPRYPPVHVCILDMLY